jgi:hypothetical protein
MRKKKTFREKLAAETDLPRVEPIPAGMARQWGEGTIVIPAPREVDEIMRQVPKGKLITINQIREAVAHRHGATIVAKGSKMFVRDYEQSLARVK